MCLGEEDFLQFSNRKALNVCGSVGNCEHWQSWPYPNIYGVCMVFSIWCIYGISQENHPIDGHIQCTYTVLANPRHGARMGW